MRFIKTIILGVFLSVVVSGAEPVRLLPNQIDKFKSSTLTPLKEGFMTWEFGSDALSNERAEYAGPGGARVRVEVFRFAQDAKAYELLTLVAAREGKQITTEYGTAGFTSADEVGFFKGAHFVRLRNMGGGLENVKALAQQLSNSFDKGENDTPALIKHLPNPEEAQKSAIFLHSFANLDRLGLQKHGVLTAVDSRGNADAAFAAYGPSKVLVIEFNTPQLAKENDDRILARIQELWKLGQPAPTAYRRVGNYSVFVFDAPDDASAKQLLDQVHYEQVISWLGENPNIYRQAEKYYIDTTLGVLVAVIKASGYALVACLGLGGLAGALLFSHRRAQQQKNMATYSDAGGMLRLNLDEMTPETDPARLLRDRN